MPESHLEGRVATVETKLQTLTESVKVISETVKQVHENQQESARSFRDAQDKAAQEMRDLFKESQRYQDRSSKSLETQIDATRMESWQHRAVSWPLVVSVMLLLLILAGGSSGFVYLITKPTDERSLENKRLATHTIEILSATKFLAADNLHEIEKLWLKDDVRLEWQAEHAKESAKSRGEQDSRLDALESRLDRRTNWDQIEFMKNKK